jgi:RHS repeat-associated protein
LGEGFSLSGAGGYIQRQYAPCGDIISGTISGSNNTGQTKPTGDQCWDGYNAYLSLGGHSGDMVYDPSGGGTWHLAGDDGSTVNYIRGGNNGSYNNTYWEIITPDGTQYWFGLNQLPGYQAGNAVTNSVWTMPVVGLGSGSPCNTAGSYSQSVCNNMAWRWNLDLVVDPNGNAISYFYSPETNYYAFDSTSSGPGSTWLQYDTGGTLTDIWYGQQDVSTSSPNSGGNIYAHKPLHVQLTYADRCSLYGGNNTNYGNQTTVTTCENNENTSGGYWPDMPWDLHCGSASGCSNGDHTAPTFFETQMLATITTSAYEGSNPYQNIDTWTLGYNWLTAPVESDLTLASITHAGDVGSSTLTMPPVTFNWTQLPNRVNYDTSVYSDMSRYRLSDVFSETGSDTQVTYNTGVCNPGNPGTPPNPSTNTWPCFQQKWGNGDFGGTGPVTTSWFYKYTASQVKVDDSTGGNPPLVTSYVYCGNLSCSDTSGDGAAWHYDTDTDLVPTKDKSYGQWRGYEFVHVIAGAATDTQSETDYTFMRGMDQDPVQPGGGFTPVSLAPTRPSSDQPGSVADANALNGFVLEKITYDGLGSQPQVSDVINWPWTTPTGTSASQPWGGTLTSALTGIAETDSYTTLTSGTLRQTQVNSTFNSTTGVLTQVDNIGDLSLAGTSKSEELCTVNTYPSPVSSGGLLDYPDEVATTTGACGSSNPTLVSDTKLYYDGLAFGTAPVSGNVTETDVYSSGDPGVAAHWVKQSRQTYDAYGRVLTNKNAAGFTTTTTYTSSYGTGRSTTQIAVASPLTATTTATATTNLAVSWGLPSSVVDPGGQTTTYQYDQLGRLHKVWLPAEPTASAASYIYSYNVNDTAPSAVTAEQLVKASANEYFTTVQLFDSLLRPRQTQTTSDASQSSTVGMAVTDTLYDSRGDVAIQNGPYDEASTSPSTTLWIPGSGSTPDETLVANETASTYDGAGRITEQDLDSFGNFQWDTTWSYPGADKVIEMPPSGGTITATYTNALGQTSEIDQYHSQTAPTGAYDATRYTYTPAGQLASIADTGGNQWTYGYDLLGRQISATDPDTGQATSAYNDLNQLTSSTDGSGNTVSYAFDEAGRTTTEYNTTGGVGETTSDELAAWAYDVATITGGGTAVGQLASYTAYDGGTGGAAYGVTINSYDPSYQPTKTTYSIPSRAVTGGLGGSYVFNASYNPNGSPASETYPAVGTNILPSETVDYGYDQFGFPDITASSIDDYATRTYYDFTNDPAEIDLGLSATAQWSKMDYAYDPATLRLQSTSVERQITSPALDSNVSYSYDHFGNLTAAADAATSNDQCYQYDYLDRLTAAWAQSSATCPTQVPGTSGLGGPAPYEQLLTYDTAGTANGSASGTTGTITGNTLIAGSGGSATTTATTMSYVAGGSSQPHAPVSQSTSINGGSPTPYTWSWNSDGTLSQITTGTTTTQSYSWGAQGMVPGQLTATTTAGTGGSTTTNYRDDASGNLLIRQDATSGGATVTTLYLPDEEITSNGSTTSATRYYSDAGQVIATRSGTSANPGSTTVAWLLGNSQGTDTTEIDANSQALTQRYYTPFGVPVGAAPSSWPGTRGFVGGTTDSTSGLTDLGAREYNPAVPEFVSPDSLLSPYTPEDFDPYDYATNDPVNSSDPTGQLPQICDGADYCGSGGPALYGYGCDASCEASFTPYPVGNIGDLLGGIQNSVLTALSGVVKVSEYMTDPASVITGTPGADAIDKFKATLTRDEGLDTRSDLYDLGNIGGTAAQVLIPGALAGDAARAGAVAIDDTADVAADQLAALKTAVEQRYQEVLATQSNSARGPVLSGAMNTRTGEVYFGQNTGIPNPLAPQLRSAIEDFEGPGAPGKGIPGAHSEINAVNQGLFADPSSQISDYLLYNLRLRGALKGQPIVMCSNCTTILSS